VVESATYYHKVEEMLEFSGKHNNSLDAKGRLIIPAPFRESLSAYDSATLVITNEVFDKCLSAYPIAEWKKLVDKVKALPQTSDAVKYYMRRVIGSATKCEMDKQGRILVSAALRKDAGLTNEIVLIGLGDRIEIWDNEEFDSVAGPSKTDREAFKEEFNQLGL
jgi:MraZ protein